MAELARSLRTGAESREEFQERLQERIGRLTRLTGGPVEAGAAGTTSSTTPVPPPPSPRPAPPAPEHVAVQRFQESQRAFDDDAAGGSVDIRR